MASQTILKMLQPKGRTVHVGAQAGPDGAMKQLRQYLMADGVTAKIGKQNNFYLPPGKQRVKREINNCKRINNKIFQEKMNLIMRQSGKC